MANIFQAIAGAVALFSLKGNDVAIDYGFVSVANADANQTLTATEYKNKSIKVTGAITATRNVVLPTTSGAVYHVHNACTGGSLLFKTTAGTGPTVAAGKTATIICDGTDYVQIGAASP